MNLFLSIPSLCRTIPFLLLEGAIPIISKSLPISLTPFSTNFSYNVSGVVIVPANAPAHCTSSNEKVQPGYIQKACEAVVNNIIGQDSAKAESNQISSR